jgi:hypothetical protein
MDFKALQRMSPEERRDTLESLTDKRERRTYMKELMPEQLAEAKDQLAQASMKIASLEDDLRVARKKIKAELDPIKEEYAEVRNKIKSQAIETEADCYVVRDHEGNQIHYVAPDGVCVFSRTMNPEERNQMRIMDNKLRDVI